MPTKSFTQKLTSMSHDIKRIADDEWESANPIDFRGQQSKSPFVQRAWSDWNDDDYLSAGVDALKNTGASLEFARYNTGTDSRKALDIAHLNLDDYYGSHITGSGLPNGGSAYAYNPEALKVLPKDIGKLSTNEQGDVPEPRGGLRPKNFKAHRRSLGLPDLIPTVSQAPNTVEEEDESPPELEQVGDPHAKPKDSEADIQAERLASSSHAPTWAETVLHKGAESSVAGGDAGGTVRFSKETEGGEAPKAPVRRVIKLKPKGVSTLPAPEPAPAPAPAKEAEKKKDSDVESGSDSGSDSEESEVKTVSSKTVKSLAHDATAEPSEGAESSEARGGSGYKTSFIWSSAKEMLVKAFPGITQGRKGSFAEGKMGYGALDKEQKRFMASIAQGRPGKPSDDMMENYKINQGDVKEKQHDYMMKLIDAHDKKAGKKGLVGWDTNLTQVAEQIPSLTLAKHFSLSPEGRDIIYQSATGIGVGWVSPKLKNLTDHDLDVLLTIYGRTKATIASGGKPPFGERRVSSAVSKNAEGADFPAHERRLKAKSYER